MPSPSAPTDWTSRPVGELMTRNVISAPPSEPMNAIRNLLDRGSFHHLPIVDDGTLVGMISLRDLALAALLECAPEGHACRARDVMSVAPACVLTSCTLREAAQLMLEHEVGALPVVGDKRELLGIVTRTDLLGALARCGAA